MSSASPWPHSLLEETVLCLKGNHSPMESAPQGKVHFWSESWLLSCTLSTKDSRNQIKMVAQIHRDLLTFSTQHLNREPSPDEEIRDNSLILKRVIFPEFFQ